MASYTKLRDTIVVFAEETPFYTGVSVRMNRNEPRFHSWRAATALPGCPASVRIGM